MNKARILTYLLLLFFFAAAVKHRQKEIVKLKKSFPPTFYGLWEKKGKPVAAGKIFRKEAPVFEKITLKPGNGAWTGCVPGSVGKKIETGREIFFETGKKKIRGRITRLSERISLDTGMYPVEAVFDGGARWGEWIVARVKTGEIPNALFVPRNSLVWEEDGYYLWKVDGDGKAERVRVEARLVDDGAIILSGAESGDKIIHEGFTALYPGDKVLEVPRLRERP